MLLFRSEENIDAWCKKDKMPRGEILSLEQTWHLSKLWYHNRLSKDFAGRSVAEAEAIFAEVGLTSSFWKFT